MTGPGPLLSGDALRSLLHDLDRELERIPDLPVIELAVVGGAAMALQWHLRSTSDVDVISDGMPPQLHQAAQRVAVRHALPADWLNDAAKGFVPQVPYDGVEVFRGRAVIVTVPSARYLLAMKLYSSREADLDDAVFLAGRAGITTTSALLDLVTAAYGRRPIPPKVQYFAEEVAVRAETTRRHRPQLRRQPPGEDLDHI